MTASKNLSEFFRWFVFLSYCLLLYVAYTLPGNQIPPAVGRANDKVLHFFNFLLLALLAFRTLARSSVALLNLKAEMLSSGFSLFYGTFLEWAQRSVPGREMSFLDWLADTVGVLAAVATFRTSEFPRKSFPNP